MRCLVCGNDTIKLCLAYDEEDGRIMANWPVCDDCRNEGVSAVQMYDLCQVLIWLDGDEKVREVEDEILAHLGGLLPPYHVSHVSPNHPFITLIPWSAEVTTGKRP